MGPPGGFDRLSTSGSDRMAVAVPVQWDWWSIWAASGQSERADAHVAQVGVRLCRGRRRLRCSGCGVVMAAVKSATAPAVLSGIAEGQAAPIDGLLNPRRRTVDNACVKSSVAASKIPKAVMGMAPDAPGIGTSSAPRAMSARLQSDSAVCPELPSSWSNQGALQGPCLPDHAGVQTHCGVQVVNCALPAMPIADQGSAPGKFAPPGHPESGQHGHVQIRQRVGRTAEAEQSPAPAPDEVAADRSPGVDNRIGCVNAQR